MSPDIEIVPTIWQYSRVATLQLSGFVLFPPRCQVSYRPCVTRDDRETMAVLDWFATRLPETVRLVPHFMEHDRLMRRAVGRNECALTSQAPIVWMADVDYVTSADDLDAIINAWPKGHKLAHPGRVHSSTPVRGMELIDSVTNPAVVPLDLASDFPEIQRKRIAIGGLQVFDGEHCRKTGYCGPVGRGRLFRPAKRWQPTKEDRWARAAAGEDVTMPITVLYRVRHMVRSEGAKEDARL